MSGVAGLDPITLPSPSRVVTALWDSREAAVANLVPTLVEALVGCGLSVVLATLTAIALDRWTPVRRAVEPLLVTSQTIPIVAIAPLFVIWFGFGLLPKVLIVVLVTFFPVTVALLDGFGRVDADAMLLMRSLGATPRQTFRALRWPSALPSLFTGLRISVVYAVIGAIFGEYVGATDGLGIWMKLSQTSFRTDLVFGAILLDRDRLGGALSGGRGGRAGGRARGRRPDDSEAQTIEPSDFRGDGPRLDPRGHRWRDDRDAIGRVEVPLAAAVTIGLTVLPDDPVGFRIDDDDTVAEVVVGRDQPIRQLDGETRMIQPAGPGPRPVAPQHLPVPVHLEDGAGVRVVDDEDIAVRQELGVGRVGRRDVDVEDHMTGSIEADDSRPVDLGDKQAAIRERRVAVGTAVGSRGVHGAGARSTPLPHDLLGLWRPR